MLKDECFVAECRDATCRVMDLASPLQLRGTPRPYMFRVKFHIIP